MRRKLIRVTIMVALVRVVIASASPVVDAVLVALAGVAPRKRVG